MSYQTPSTRQKALMINLDSEIYGTFAEIGAGQEVVRAFFTAGGASGTIAKSMSAYDMTFSDSIYGKEESGRYVCEKRLRKMLDHEFSLLQERLQAERGKKSHFFTFANTVAAKQYKKDNESHGWMGVRFQHEPQAAPSDVVVHIRLLDNQNLLQQKVLGAVGVNLLHACYFQRDSHTSFLDALMDHLESNQIEIDMVKAEGPAFAHFNQEMIGLELVKKGFTHTILFNSQGELALPSECLYKKPILLLRGSFNPPTLATVDMFSSGTKLFLKNHPDVAELELVTLAEMTVNPGSDQKNYDDQAFLERVHLLQAMGKSVLVSNYHKYYKLSSYFARFTKSPVGIILGVYNFKQIFEQRYYEDLPGGIMESLGLLFRPQVEVYIYPYLEEDGTLTKLANLNVEGQEKCLADYLAQSGSLFPLTDVDHSTLNLYSRKVHTMIQTNEKGWEEKVPAEIIPLLKKK